MRIPITPRFHLLLAAGALLATAAYADSPRDFLQKALQGDNSEIMLGHMAADQAQSPRVRDFGNMLVRDHTQAREEVLGVGRQMGLEDSHEVAPEAREERGRLARLHGHEFDQEFARYMVQDHRQDIGEFRDEAREHHGPVSDLAGRQLPTLRQHLEMAMALSHPDDDRMGGDRDRDNRDHDDSHNR